MLRGVSPWKGWGSGGFNQAAAEARWLEIGQMPPAPLIPPSLIGWHEGAGRDAIALYKGNDKKSRRFATKVERDFMNLWGKVAEDPYRKQSTISKIAGGILKVAAVVVPAVGYAQMAVDAGNTVTALSKQGSDEKLAARVLTPAIVASGAAEEVAHKAASDELLQRQLDVLSAALPASALPVSTHFAPSFTTAPASPVRPVSTFKTYAPWLLGAGALLFLLRKPR
jgi:hypothetical protein